MKHHDVDRLDEYLGEARSWSWDREQARRRALRLAWVVAGMATFIAGAEAIALAALAPLKTVVPYTLLVDRQTGYVQALDPLKGDRVTPTAALTRSFLVQYVIARESFLFDALQQNYRKTVLWSDGDVRTRYISLMQASNPLSPLTLYPRRTIVDVQIKSVSLLDNHTALVRFETTREDPGAQARPEGSWIATLSFHYSNSRMTAEERLNNPLGFRVDGYHKDPEILADARPANTPTPAADGQAPAPRLVAPPPVAVAPEAPLAHGVVGAPPPVRDGR